MRKKRPAYATAETHIKVPFHDVDSAMIAWHGHYVKYLEVARCELLDQINYNYTEMRESGFFWPVVDMGLRYVAPATFGQEIKVKATITEWEHRLRIDYEISDVASNKRLTRAHTVQVAVNADSGELMLASPGVLANRLGINRA